MRIENIILILLIQLLIFVSINAGKWEACREFFGTLYTFIYVLGTYLKPHVSIQDLNRQQLV
jgi:hypothetical protein